MVWTSSTEGSYEAVASEVHALTGAVSDVDCVCDLKSWSRIINGVAVDSKILPVDGGHSVFTWLSIVRAAAAGAATKG